MLAPSPEDDTLGRPFAADPGVTYVHVPQQRSVLGFPGPMLDPSALSHAPGHHGLAEDGDLAGFGMTGGGHGEFTVRAAEHGRVGFGHRWDGVTPDGDLEIA